MLCNDWQKKSKRWGHPLHAMCSYMGMFPARLPHYFIQKFSNRGDFVLDPFCGRGTTPLQACLEGRVGIGVDSSPLAYALTAAKVKPPDRLDLLNRLDALSNDMFFSDVCDEPEEIRMLFHEDTLRQLVHLRENLDASDRTDAFIIGVLLGMLHGGALGRKGPRKKKRQAPPTFLSVPMPNTFSMSKGYIAKYIREKGLVAPRVDVFLSLNARIDRLLRMGPPLTEGCAWLARAQDLGRLGDVALKKKEVQLTVSSPPYLKVLKYGLYNWIRLWFLHERPEELDARLDQHRNLEDYLEFMAEICRVVYRVTRSGGVLALVIGDVKKGKQPPIRLAEEVWAFLKRRRTRWRLAEIVEDVVPRETKVSRIWGESRGEATAIDRVLVLYKDSYREIRDTVAW